MTRAELQSPESPSFRGGVGWVSSWLEEDSRGVGLFLLLAAYLCSYAWGDVDGGAQAVAASIFL